LYAKRHYYYFAAVPTLFRRLNHYTTSSQKPVPNPNHRWIVMHLRASSCTSLNFDVRPCIAVSRHADLPRQLTTIGQLLYHFSRATLCSPAYHGYYLRSRNKQNYSEQPVIMVVPRASCPRSDLAHSSPALPLHYLFPRPCLPRLPEHLC